MIRFRKLCSRAVVIAGLFAAGIPLQAQPAPDLRNVAVYPNPFKPSDGHTAVVFGNLTADARIRIYKLTGEQVADIAPAVTDGRATWGAVNSGGDPVASGVYIYYITNSAGNSSKGKIAIIR